MIRDKIRNTSSKMAATKSEVMTSYISASKQVSNKNPVFKRDYLYYCRIKPEMRNGDHKTMGGASGGGGRQLPPVPWPCPPVIVHAFTKSSSMANICPHMPCPPPRRKSLAPPMHKTGSNDNSTCRQVSNDIPAATPKFQGYNIQMGLATLL